MIDCLKDRLCLQNWIWILNVLKWVWLEFDEDNEKKKYEKKRRKEITTARNGFASKK